MLMLMLPMLWEGGSGQLCLHAVGADMPAGISVL